MPIIKWNSLTDKPNIGQICLVLHKNDHINIMTWDGEIFVSRGQTGFDRGEAQPVTHWCALENIGRPYGSKEYSF